MNIFWIAILKSPSACFHLIEYNHFQDSNNSKKSQTAYHNFLIMLQNQTPEKEFPDAKGKCRPSQQLLVQS